MIEHGIELARDVLAGEAAPIYRLGSAPAAAAGHSAAPWLSNLSCAVAIGAFDGCHIGHRELVRRTVADARARGIASVAVTFDPDPDEVVSRAPALKLMTVADRLRALALTGVDFVVVVPFTRELAALDHDAFFTRVLAAALDVRAVHVGSDFRLGARGASTVAIMRAWGAERGIDVVGHDLVHADGSVVSATRIRSLVAAGDVSAARVELGRRPLVRGTVVHGRGQGTGMGFPTANILVPEGLQLPAEGVYAGFAVLGCEAWPAAINVGVPPMFAKSAASARLEANLLGFDGDLYGRELAVVFDRRLRAPESFASVEELVATVNNDIASTRALLGADRIEVRP